MKHLEGSNCEYLFDLFKDIDTVLEADHDILIKLNQQYMIQRYLDYFSYVNWHK